MMTPAECIKAFGGDAHIYALRLSLRDCATLEKEFGQAQEESQLQENDSPGKKALVGYIVAISDLMMASDAVTISEETFLAGHGAASAVTSTKKRPLGRLDVCITVLGVSLFKVKGDTGDAKVNSIRVYGICRPGGFVEWLRPCFNTSPNPSASNTYSFTHAACVYARTNCHIR